MAPNGGRDRRSADPAPVYDVSPLLPGSRRSLRAFRGATDVGCWSQPSQPASLRGRRGRAGRGATAAHHATRCHHRARCRLRAAPRQPRDRPVGPPTGRDPRGLPSRHTQATRRHRLRLLPRLSGEEPADYRARVLGGISERVDGLGAHPEPATNGHVFDALIAAYTGWLGPGLLEPPPQGFNIASGWIWFPKLGSNSNDRLTIARILGERYWLGEPVEPGSTSRNRYSNTPLWNAHRITSSSRPTQRR